MDSRCEPLSPLESAVQLINPRDRLSEQVGHWWVDIKSSKRFYAQRQDQVLVRRPSHYRDLTLKPSQLW